MKANHNRDEPQQSTNLLLSNIQRTKVESKSQRNQERITRLNVVIKYTKNKSWKQITTKWWRFLWVEWLMVLSSVDIVIAQLGKEHYLAAKFVVLINFVKPTLQVEWSMFPRRCGFIRCCQSFWRDLYNDYATVAQQKTRKTSGISFLMSWFKYIKL